ncbi:MAG: glyceraldehyde 3-phosphate dehydrogenase NAD-binding domain-containing protein, partial [Bacteroidales bacterium]|nr:glyceraldehyde 3-phosphate dehydrogenase NAD-binding domain-containing protein [Bacteroidales bacterium]
MSIRIGINGFGRIGKMIFKLAVNSPEIEVVHLNDRMDNKMMSHLLKYDSVHGRFDAEIDYDNDCLIVNGKKITVTHFPSPSEIPWDKSNVETVIESSGRFKTRELLLGHIKNGAKKVILSSPSEDKSIDRTVVMGINHTEITPTDRIVSNASCTTNCVAMMIRVLDEVFGIQKALMNTVHPFTNNQNLQDGYHTDPRRARSALNNIIPTSTSAIGAIHQIYPHLADCFDGIATRVPVADCSFVELYAHLKRKTTVN